MGHGIAQVLAAAGLTVRLHDVDPARLERARDAIRANLDLFVREGLTTPDAAARALARVRVTADLAEAVAEADVVVEAVYEDLALKQSIFARLAGLCPPHTLMASNTSGLSVNRIAEASPCPERVLVAHFWNPPHIIPIVEVVPGLRTAPATTEAIMACCAAAASSQSL